MNTLRGKIVCLIKLFIYFPRALPGIALGWYVAALSGLRKKMYTLIDLSEF